MKNLKHFYLIKTRALLFALTALACVFLATCENPIIEKWWDDPDPEYVPITKMIPQVTYETVIEHDIVYKQVFVQLPPEIIHDTIVKEVEVEKDVPVYIIQTIIEQVPEIVVQTLTNNYVNVQNNINLNVETSGGGTPTDDEINQYIKEHSEEVLKIIKDEPNWKTILNEIIKDIPPDELITYLTDEQIKYIIQQQPPQIILQTLNIVDIEYIIFAGNADVYNGPPGPGGNTPLTSQEISSNKASVSDIAQALKDNPEYLIMLHGHANPVDFTDGETVELTKLSLDRANSVEAALRTQYKSINGGTDIEDSRVTVSGYGGEKVLFGNNSAYTALNRRVEMILVWVGVK